MTLQDAMEKFHKEWGHKGTPRIFQIVNKFKSKHDEQDLYNLVWHLHEHWDRLKTPGEKWGAATLEIRMIMARRREMVAEKMKVTDKETAEKLIANLHGAMGVE